MANKDDYLTEYRQFFEVFAQTVNPNDQLPVKLASYKLMNVEVVGAIVDWTTQYLNQKKCPQSLQPTLVQIVVEEIRKACKKQPILCGFNPPDNAYDPLQFMQTVVAKTYEVCLRYLDNSTLCTLPSPGLSHNMVSMCAIKNTRRRMEDRHVVIHDLNTLFSIQEASPSSYYAIFDGHAGHDAAAYSAAHLHQYLAESKNFVSNPCLALQDAFCKTDALFIEKCKVESFSSGTTAVCALLKPKEKTLYIAWVGDSQALIANRGRVLQCVEPHRPCRKDEKDRIEQEGGMVIFWGTWRVSGQLAVSRAIGDFEYKPYVIAIPDVREISLNGGEDFIILACDGLWDYLSEDDAAIIVYNMVRENPDDTDSISQRLVQSAKERGSSDNISVIVVFLREPSKIAAEAQWADRNGMDAGLDNTNNQPQSNPFASEILKDNNAGFLYEGYKQNGTEFGRNGKASSDFDEDDDLGPETDVDALDDGVMIPTKPFSDGLLKDEEKKVDEEVDHLELQKKQSSEFDEERSPREETPTPPADAVHDASALVAESGEESEDEWNYFKGDSADKENFKPSDTDAEVAQITEASTDLDNMSQLNPDAAEFVPVSPTCLALMNDQVIAQSPKKANANIDISVPNLQEFESEVKRRPSEVLYSNGHESESGQKLSSQEIMENLLNGKNLDDIEFQPNTAAGAVKTEEFHFGPNAAPFTSSKPLDQSEALSTKAVFGDESTASYMEDANISTFESTFADTDISAIPEFHPKSQDPMSTSFYQDREDDSNPFDLNKVQVLPDNIDEFLNKSDTSFNDTISDLPSHNPLDEISKNDVTESTQITDLDKPVPSEEAVKTGDLLGDFQSKSPVGESDSSFEHIASPVHLEQDAKSPFEEIKPEAPQTEDLCTRSPAPELEVCQRPEFKSPVLSPEPAEIRASPEVISLEQQHVLEQSEDICLRPESKSPAPESVEDVCLRPSVPQSPLLFAEPNEDVRPESKSPLPESEHVEPAAEFCPRPESISSIELQITDDICLRPESGSSVLETQSPLPQSHSPAEMICVRPESKSPLPESQCPVPDVCLQPESSAPEAPSPAPSDEICLSAVKSPEPEAPTPEPQGDICQRPIITPEPEAVCSRPETSSPTPEILVEQVAKEEISSEGLTSPIEDITSSVKDEVASPVISPVPKEVVELPPENFDEKEVDSGVDSNESVPQTTNNLNFIPEMSNAILLNAGSVESVPGPCFNSTPKSVISETFDTESVVTADVNSILEKCNLPDIASPFSTSEQVSESTILTQNESTNLEEKLIDIAPATSILEPTVINESSGEVKENESESKKEKIVAAAAVVGAVVAAATTGAVATTVSGEKKGIKAKTTPTAKKPATSATKSIPPKAPTTGAKKPSTPTTRTLTSKPLAAKPAPTKTTPVAAPKTSTTATTAKPRVSSAKQANSAEKKPLTNGDVKPAQRSSAGAKKPTTNGDVKPAMRTALTARKTSDTVTAKTASGTSASKTPVTKTTPTKPSPRPQTAPAAKSTSLSAAAKPRPTTLGTRPTTKTVTSTTTAAPKTSAATKPSLSAPGAKTTTSPIKPRPATAPLKARVPLTKTVTKGGPETEKQLKETVNKQLSASSRTTARTSASKGPATTTVKKTEPKTFTSRTTSTKTTVTAVKSTTKKPETLTRLSGGNAKSTAKSTAKAQENGIAVVEEITVVTTTTLVKDDNEPRLVKDNSPLDNNILIDNILHQSNNAD